MAFSVQISWQQKQVMQVSASTWGREPSRERAPTGQCSTQLPQAVQSSGSAWGRSTVRPVDQPLDGLILHDRFPAQRRQLEIGQAGQVPQDLKRI